MFHRPWRGRCWRTARAPCQRAITCLGNGHRTKEPVRSYIWGPDAMALLQEMEDGPTA